MPFPCIVPSWRVAFLSFPLLHSASRSSCLNNRCPSKRCYPTPSIRAALPTERHPPTKLEGSQSLSRTTAFFFAFAASTLGALVGAGGGMFLTPLLVSRGVSQRKAHGTSMLMICAVSLISSMKYLTAASANASAAALLAIPALLTAPVGASYTATMHMKSLRRAFGAFLLLVAISIPLLPRILSTGLSISTWWLLPVGACTGFVSGLLGVGGGSINVPTLVLVGFPQRMAQGTALLAMVLPSIRACLTHIRLRNVLTDLFIPLLCGAFLGGALGASTAVMLPEATLRIVCSVFLLFISFRFLSA